MRIHGEERAAIEELFPREITEFSQMKEFFDDELCHVLSKTNKFRSVADRIDYYDANNFRPYDSVKICKIVHPKFKLSETLTAFVDSLTPPFLFFIDFNFCVEASELNPKYDSRLKIQLGSKASSWNQNFKIVSNKDAVLLKNEFINKSYSEFLSLAFLHHSRLFELSSSGLRPYSLISLLLHVQKFS